MSAIALLDTQIFVHGYDVTGQANKVTLGASAEEKDATTFGSGGYRERKATLKDVMANCAGLFDGTLDAEGLPDLGVADRVCSFLPTNAEATTAYFAQMGKFKYEILGSVGDLAPFALDMSGTNTAGLIRGVSLVKKTDVSTTGAKGTAFQLGAVGGSQYLYGAFHVFGTPGTTITAVIESDDANTFASATTRISFTTVTAAGGYWGTKVAGAITDDWYRLRVSAITGTFTIAAFVGIGNT